MLAVLLLLCAAAVSAEQSEPERLPVYADGIAEGSYDIQVSSDSSMFRIVHARLTVQDGSMSAELTLGGKGYRSLFMGTGVQAAVGADGECPYSVAADGSYVYTVPVSAVNVPIPCTAYSIRRSTWYDHSIVFLAETLPQKSLLVTPFAPQPCGLKDGRYTIDVRLEGGSGRAAIASPARLRVKDGLAYADIAWSSSSYDYMKVNGTTYLPVIENGSAVFTVPVLAFDRDMPVIADTTAMSRSHEIVYYLTFDSGSARKMSGSAGAAWKAGAVVCVLLAVIGCVAVCVRRKRA